MHKPENAKELINVILFSSVKYRVQCLLNSKWLWMGGHNWEGNCVLFCEQQNQGQPCWVILAFKWTIWAIRNTKHIVQGHVLSFTARAQEILKKKHTVQMFVRQATLFMKVCKTALLNPMKELFFSKQKQSQSQKVRIWSYPRRISYCLCTSCLCKEQM